MNRRTALASLALAWPLASHAHEYYLLSFTLIHPWAYPTEPGQSSAAVYFSVQDVLRPDRLLQARSPVAEWVAFRAPGEVENSRVDELVIGPATQAQFGPEGFHLRLEGLRSPLQLYAVYPLMLTFEHSGRVLVQISVGAH